MSSFSNGDEYMDYIPCKRCKVCANFRSSNNQFICKPGYGKLEYSGKGDAASTIARQKGGKYTNCEHFISKYNTRKQTTNKLTNAGVLAIMVVIMGGFSFLLNPLLFIKNYWFIMLISLLSIPFVAKCESILSQKPNVDIDGNKKFFTIISLIAQVLLIVGNFSVIKENISIKMVIFLIIFCLAVEFFVVPLATSIIVVVRDYFRLSKIIAWIFTFIAFMLVFVVVNHVMSVFFIVLSTTEEYMTTSSAVEVIKN